jgi:hypothetical protein
LETKEISKAVAETASPEPPAVDPMLAKYAKMLKTGLAMGAV